MQVRLLCPDRQTERAAVDVRLEPLQCSGADLIRRVRST